MGEGPPLLIMDSLCFWNVGVINNPRKQKEILGFLHENKVGFCGLVETKLKKKSARKVMQNKFSTWSIATNLHIQNGGRLLIAWNRSIFEVNILFLSDQIIHTDILHVPTRKAW